MAEALPLPSIQQHLGQQRAVAEESPVTLLVRHLPEGISHDTVTRLFSHYGASSVRNCSRGRVKNCAFVDFSNEILAAQAQMQLHGLQFLGKVLSVKRASKADSPHQESDIQTGKVLSPAVKDTSVPKVSRDYPRGCYIHPSEPIAKKLGVDYPFPPHLEYVYPPPDIPILTNIVNALVVVPHFYTQVLHLMNKMNIPAPFGKALPTPALPIPLPVPISPPPPPPRFSEAKMEGLSSGESEIESSDEEIHRKSKPNRKRIKRQAIVGPGVDKDVDHEDVGLKSVALVSKEKPIIKKNNPVIQINIKQSQHIQMDDVAGKEPNELRLGTSVRNPFASVQELNMGKLPPEEILSLPRFKHGRMLAAIILPESAHARTKFIGCMDSISKDSAPYGFRGINFFYATIWPDTLKFLSNDLRYLMNYTTGDPTPVLYIKNLAKDVVVDDFYFIFGSFFASIDAAKSNLSIKLMQEGRMRGQAFVTFPTVEHARDALNVVNGYVFKGKPIVIQFGRSPAAAKLQ